MTTHNSVALTPRLSIVMPFFNQKDMVAEMIDSILANDYQDWELLAVDDGSEADTTHFLQKRYEKDTRIKIISRSREPKGAQTCRNIGLETASGEYVAFFDSDDIVAPHCLRTRVEQMEKHSELDFMVFRSGTATAAGGKTAFDPTPTNLTFGYPISKDDVEAFCDRFLPFVVWNNIYRRQSLLSHGIRWDTRLLSLQDSMFNLQCLLAGLRYDYSPTPPDYGYRTDTPGSVSKKLKSKAHLESHVYITERFFDMVQQHYGQRYDHALYRGALQVLLQTARSGTLYRDFNLSMSATVRKYSFTWGRIFSIQVRLFHLLCRFMPLSLARQLSFLCYLLWSSRIEKRKIFLQKRVKSIEQEK
ncbi:MAG: glycosyltransferase family 2 protein [Prevotella sp.]|nr:glycosyltransferase family 2 protein [Prevotella sp.]